MLPHDMVESSATAWRDEMSGRFPINDGDILDHAGQPGQERIREYIAEQNLMAAIELDERLVIQPAAWPGSRIKVATVVGRNPGTGYSPPFCSGL